MGAVVTLIDLNACDREPIHVPGSIQPYGVMLVADQAGLVILHVAGDIELHLGLRNWQGLTVAAALGSDLGGKVAALVRQPMASSGFMGKLVNHADISLDVSAHLSGSDVIIELEPAAIGELPASVVLDRLSGAAANFERTASVAALCDRAAIEFRNLTGYDRVMVYRFLDDDFGRVVAEDRRQGMHAFLHHHFPAGDIPRQARALYLRNLVRVIPDIAYQPAQLQPGWTGTQPLDMSDSSLRSVSPVHLQYLRNMGIRASASVSIVKDGTLWGLIACHHEAPRSIAYDVRAACRSLAGSMAREIKAKEEAEGYRQRIRLRSFEDDMVALLSRDGSLDDALSNHLDEMRRMMGGEGVAVMRGHEIITQGVCPGESEIRALAAWLVTRSTQTIFSTANLSAPYPPAVQFQATGSGVLAVTLSAEEPWLLLWFRVEQVEIVNWAGNPHKAAGPDAHGPLTPRASFDAWQETVSGHARDWTLPEIDAAMRLRAALLDVQKNRRLHELNRQLTKILQDKDVLLQQNEFLIGEVNHRVQNSLQLVSNYLALQARGSESPELLAALEEARRRISAVALVHRRLYRGDHIELVDAARYIEELCTDTFAFMGQDWAKHLTLSLSPVTVSTDRAVTLGLLLTELMINANKYAYAGLPGPIEIVLAQDRTLIHLTVADKGGGKVSFSKGFGSRIMDGLVTQLGGKLVYGDNQPGLRTKISIPIETSRPLE